MEEITITEKKFEFRTLEAPDVFSMFKLLNKIGIRQFKECFESESVKNAVKKSGKDGAAVEAIGIGIVMDIAGIIVQNLPSCEDEIYSMLASVSNLDREQIKSLGMVEFFEMIVEFIEKPEFKDFMKVVSRLFK